MKQDIPHIKQKGSNHKITPLSGNRLGYLEIVSAKGNDFRSGLAFVPGR
jgi:hypothetical protein